MEKYIIQVLTCIVFTGFYILLFSAFALLEENDTLKWKSNLARSRSKLLMGIVTLFVIINNYDFFSAMFFGVCLSIFVFSSLTDESDKVIYVLPYKALLILLTMIAIMHGFIEAALLVLAFALLRQLPGLGKGDAYVMCVMADLIFIYSANIEFILAWISMAILHCITTSILKREMDWRKLRFKNPMPFVPSLTFGFMFCFVCLSVTSGHIGLF